MTDSRLCKGAGVERSGHQLPPPRKSEAAGRPLGEPAEHTSKGGGALPCLYRNNSNESDTDPLKLKAKYRKTATALSWNVQALAERHGIEKVGFLTLTFADHVVDPKEAQKRFNSLRSGVLSSRYDHYIRVMERQKSGRIHYHLVVVCDSDIRTGSDFSQFSKGVYSSANPSLRSEWKFWRETAPLYNFGRTELLPIRSTAEGIGRYVGKYIGKHFESRRIEDKGIRLAEYSRGARMASVRHTPLNKGTEAWRAKLPVFAAIVGYRFGLNRPSTLPELSRILGDKWAFLNREFILSLPEAPKNDVVGFEAKIAKSLVDMTISMYARVDPSEAQLCKQQDGESREN